MIPQSLPFARPTLLLLLGVLPVLGVLSALAAARRRAALGRFGTRPTVLGLSTLHPKARYQSRLLLYTGLTGLIAAAAGPRWGKGGEGGVIVGRDVVVILDLSRSMTAADMADPVYQQRWQAAQAGVRDLVARVEQRGGHRLALVVFAARPWVACPLTSDYDHFRARLDEFSPKAPPPEVRPDPDQPILTGTSIGAAIHLALATHDPRFAGYQDIMLLSDGDGPYVETESEGGVREAADHQVPVHTVGVGDPNHATELVLGDGESVEFTKLQESLLRDVARRTHGEYLPARRDVPALGEWFAQTIEPRPSRELADDAIPQPKDRSGWFVGAALVLLLLGWWREP
jgi:Ca-activated chloride channel family protein